MKACSYSVFETRSRAFRRSPNGQLLSRAMCAFRVPFAKIRSATSTLESIPWTMMDNDTDDENNSTGSTFVPRVAGLATLHQAPARVFSEKLGGERETILSRKNLMCAQRSSYATLQEQLLGLTSEPFANLSPPFRELYF